MHKIIFFPCTSLGMVLSGELWQDVPIVNVLVQVRDELGGFQCEETSVLIRTEPEAKLLDLLFIRPQVNEKMPLNYSLCKTDKIKHN